MVGLGSPISSLGNRLRLVFGEGVEPAPAAVSAGPVLDVVVYADDCTVFGRIRLDGDRLTDMLNEHVEYQLVDVRIQRRADGTLLEEREITIRREELLAVRASGPRGDQARRTRTVPHPIVLRVGPYEVAGNLHAPAGHEPLASLRRRRPIVPLTGALVVPVDGDTSGPDVPVDVLLVNRERMTWVRKATAAASPQMPELEIEQSDGPLVRDYTPSLYA